MERDDTERSVLQGNAMRLLSDAYENGMTGEEIRNIRTKYRLTQEEFGQQLGLSKRQVWSLEHNEKNTTLISEKIRSTKFVRPRRDYGISGEQVVRIRQKEGLSQEEFGRKLGLTKRQVWSMEHNKRNSKSRRELVITMEPPGEDIILSGKHLKMIREMTGLSQAKFAKALDLSQNTYFSMEHRETNTLELTAKVRRNYPEEFEWVTSRFSVQKVVKEDVKIPEPGLTGIQIRSIRMFTGLSQVEFAERIGISQLRLSYNERSSKGNVALEAAIAQEFPEEYRMVTAKHPDDDLETISGRQLQHIRKLTGLSQNRFGERIGLSQSRVNDCEHQEKLTLTVNAKIRTAFPEEYNAVVKGKPENIYQTETYREPRNYVASGSE